MNWKTLAAFICIQAAGVWCVYSSTGQADFRLMIGWWVLLLPGSFVALLVPFNWGVNATIVVTVSANAIIWYSVTRAVRRLKR